MSSKATVAAVLIAASLGGGYWYWEVKTKPAREQAREDAKRVFPELKAEETGEMLLRKDKDPEVLLRKVAGVWRLLKPVQALADAEAVNELLKQLKDVKREEVVDEKATDTHKYGLDEPSGAVTFLPVSGGAKAQVLFFGADSFDGSKAYAMVDGKPDVFLTALAGKSAVLKNADALRDKRLFNFGLPDVVAVRSNAEGGFVLARDKAGVWTVTAHGATEPGEPGKVEAWLSDLSALKGSSVVEEAGQGLGRFGLGANKVEVDFANGKQVLQRGKVKDKGPEFYGRLQDTPQVWLLPGSAATTLNKGGHALMELHAFDFKPGLVDHVAVWEQGSTLTARRRSDLTWAWDAPVKLSPNATAGDVLDLIARVAGAEYLSRLPLTAKPAHPSAVLTFYDKNDQAVEVAWVGSRQGGGTLVYSGMKKLVSIVASNLFDALPPPGKK